MSLRTALSLLFISVVVSFALISSATPRTAGRDFRPQGKVSQPRAAQVPANQANGAAFVAEGADANAAVKSRPDAEVLTGGAAAIMAANNFRLLQPWEYAVANIRTDDDATDVTNAVVQLADGQQHSFTQTVGSTTTILENRPGVATFVREGDGVAVHGRAPDDPNDKIDSRLLNSATLNSPETQVIIRFKMSFQRFYDHANRSASVRSQKRREFNDARRRVAAVINGRGRIKRDLLIVNSVAATIKPSVLEQLAKDETVVRIEPDITAHIALDSSVDEIHARETWQLSDGNNNPLTGVGRRIAIIDTGVDYTHTDLGGCLGPNCKVIGGWNFLAGNSNPMDDNGHGTHVAATAAGNGLLKGVAPDAKILAYKVCNSSGGCASSDIIEAIEYATDPDRDGDLSDHVDVASMSIGGAGGNPDDSMSLAVDNATFAGVLSTIAAGNTGPNLSTINSPGTARSAVTVAAACKPDQIGVDGRCNGPIASFSSRGPLVWNDEDIHKPDVTAPGVNICAARWGSAFAGSPTCFDNQHIRISGTSMATPHVAGAAALVRQAFPGYSPEQVKQLLKNSARDLNTSVNDQGAGMINLQTAIPGSNKVSSQPGLWEVYTDPSVQVTRFDEFFMVTPTDPTIETLEVSFNLAVPGISVVFDKTTLNVAGQSSDGVFATMFVDNDLARTGNYTGSIVLKEGGQTKGIIPVTVHVAATVRISPSPIVDYGADNPSLASWTSETRTLTITNFRTDISQTLNISSSAFPAGISFQSPSSVTIPPEGVVTIDTNFVVDNTAVPNGSYSGTMRVANATVDASVTTKFAKFFVLTINDPQGSDILNTTAFLHNRSDMQMIFNVTSNQTSVYLDTAGPYDLVLYYLPRTDASGTHEYVVFKEGISLSGGSATVTASRSDAAFQTKMIGTDPAGASTGPLGIKDTFDNYLPAGLGVLRLTGATDYTTNYYSAVSTSYRHHEIYDGRRQAAPVLDFYYGGFVGLSANRTYTNTPADFKSVQIKTDLNRDTGSALPLVFSCPPGSNTCIANWNANFTLQLPITQTINSLLPAAASHYQVSDTLRTGCPSGGACANVFQSPYFDLASHTRKAFYFDAASFPTWDNGVAYNGLGPSLWMAKFANGSTGVRLLPYYGTRPAAFLRQDFAFQDYDAVPYELSSNGSVVASGALPTFLATSSWPTLPFIGTATPGSYQFKISSFPYFNRGISLGAQVVATFNTTLSDPNPPSLTQMKYTTAGQRSDQHDSSTTNQLYFEMDAVGGSLSQVAASFSNDLNGVFTPLTLSASGGGYTANVPAVPFTKLALRLTGVDNSNNKLEYTFELTAINPLADTQSPTTSIDSPANGQPVNGTVAVAVSAQDNIGVTRVELYQDGNLIGTDTAAPYTFSWNTDPVSAGSHTLFSKAYDGAGNVGSSNPVTVNVTHDIVPPTTSITSPTGGQTVSGVFTVQASAQDNVGVSRTELYQDGVLIGTDTVAPYTFSWNTDPISEGSHTLFSKAYDGAGNVGTSANVNVTVKHDIVPPSVSLTQPAAGAILAGTVTIAATASDDKGVARVEFYKNNILLGTDTTAPYSVQWNTTAETPGSHTLTARAVDTSDNSTTSAPRSVTVRDAVAPTVSITSPANGSTVTRRSTVTITAAASDNIGVTRVEFRVNGALTCTDTATPFNCAWQVPNTKATHSLQASAFDAAGNTTTSTTVTVTSK
jgi:subtilisin family serine protease